MKDNEQQFNNESTPKFLGEDENVLTLLKSQEKSLKAFLPSTVNSQIPSPSKLFQESMLTGNVKLKSKSSKLFQTLSKTASDIKSGFLSNLKTSWDKSLFGEERKIEIERRIAAGESILTREEVEKTMNLAIGFTEPLKNVGNIVDKGSKVVKPFLQQTVSEAFEGLTKPSPAQQAIAKGLTEEQYIKGQLDPLREFKTGVGIEDPDTARGAVKEAIDDIGGIDNVRRGEVSINKLEKTENINTRSQRYKDIEKDVKSGNITPIITDEYLRVADGHHRLEVYRSLNMDNIPVIVPKMTSGVKFKTTSQLRTEYQSEVAKSKTLFHGTSEISAAQIEKTGFKTPTSMSDRVNKLGGGSEYGFPESVYLTESKDTAKLFSTGKAQQLIDQKQLYSDSRVLRSTTDFSDYNKDQLIKKVLEKYPELATSIDTATSYRAKSKLIEAYADNIKFNETGGKIVNSQLSKDAKIYDGKEYKSKATLLKEGYDGTIFEHSKGKGIGKEYIVWNPKVLEVQSEISAAQKAVKDGLTEEQFVKSKGLHFEYENIANEKRLIIDLFPTKDIQGKGITKSETLYAFQKAYRDGQKIIEPSNGMWTKEGKGFIDNLKDNGFIKKIENRGGIERYEINAKIKDIKTSSKLRAEYQAEVGKERGGMPIEAFAAAPLLFGEANEEEHLKEYNDPVNVKIRESKDAPIFKLDSAGDIPDSQFKSSPEPSVVKRVVDSIANNEMLKSGDPYTFTKPSGKKELGNDNGKYQITDEDLRLNSLRYIGRKVTREEFLNSPKLQERYMKNRVSYQLSEGYSPSQIADIHRGGFGQKRKPGESIFRKPKYVEAFLKDYNKNDNRKRSN